MFNISEDNLVDKEAFVDVRYLVRKVMIHCGYENGNLFYTTF